MKNLLLFIFLLVSTLTISQTIILDFESPTTSTDYQYFGSVLDGTAVSPIANPDASGINTSANVMMHEKPDGAETWAGAFPNPAQATAYDFVTSTQLCVDVWSPVTGNVGLKLENSTTGGANWIVTKDVNEANTWVQICADASEVSIEDPFQPASGHIYGTLVIFFDFGSAGTGATYYFDNVITQGMGASEGDITFSVDMNGFSDPFNTVYVSGTFNDWSEDANPLEDADGDGIYTGTVADIPVGVHEYKFQLDAWTAQEEFTGGETCIINTGGFVNRNLVVSGDADLGTVCYGSCYECGQGVRININVGTSHILVDPSGFYIAGGGNFGNPGDNAMTDPDGDGVYSISLEREMGFTSFYTFTNGACGDWGCKEDISGQSCAHPDNFNDRMMGPIMEDTEINTCFAMCTDHTDCGGGGAPVDVTFQVDMTGYADPFNTVFLSGNFNSWSADANPMEDGDSDGVWETTIQLLPGDYEYKFQLDGWMADEIFADGDPCTITDPSGDFVNRALNVSETTSVCFLWNTCNACVTSTIDLEIDNNLFELRPSLVNNYSIITFKNDLADEKRVRVYNATGVLISEAKVESYTKEFWIDAGNLANGLYNVYVQAGNKIATKKFVKQ